MTRGDFIYKWFWFAVATLPIWLLEDVVFSHISPFGVRPMLLPLAAVAVAVLEGSVGGAGYGMAIGLLCYACWPQASPVIIPGLVAAGILIGIATRYGLKQSFISYFLCGTALLAVNDLVRILLGLLRHQAPLLVLMKTSAAEILVSLLFAPLIWVLLHKVFDRVGGTRLM